MKTRYSKPFESVQVKIPYEEGMDPYSGLLEMLEAKGIVDKVGNKLSYVSPVTGEEIKGQLSFVSKSASNLTKTFKIESEIENIDGKIRDGITAEMTIKTDEILAHKISPSILALGDSGELGVKIIDSDDTVQFKEVNVIEDTSDYMLVSGLSQKEKIIIVGQQYVSSGEKVSY